MSKTPVSALHELMQKRGIVPQYDLLPSEGIGTHMPIFYYRVTAENVCKVGKARSKKDAKHEAARLALEALNEMGLYHPDVTTSPSSPIATGGSATPSNIQINAVGVLKEFCSDNNIPEPEFVLISDIGPAHSRQFTMECKVGSMPGISATDLTKKKAKQAAAQKMLHRLMDSLPQVIEEFKDTNISNSTALTISQEVVDGYNENSLLKKKVNWGLRISSYPKTIKNIMNEKQLTFDSIWKDVVIEDVGALQDILNKLELTYSLDFMEDDTAFLTINTDPEYIFADVEEDRETALELVLKQTYNFLKIMTK